MNAKDLSADSALGARINDVSTKYAQSGNLLQNNSYEDIGTNSLAKLDVQNSRPCAVIGPDRVLPSSNSNDGYSKKPSVENWPCSDGTFRQPPDYPHKMSEYQPTRNISPRQTFQENMQRIMVSPYNSMKISDNPNFPVDRMLKNGKRNFPSETKYCEVPYTVNPVCSDQKSVRVSEMPVSNISSTVTRSAPIGWLPNNVNIRPLRSFGATEVYQYPDYPSCAGPRPMPMIRPHRTVHDEPGRIYPERYYQDPNVRFRPYPPTKESYSHTRYDYISNYSNTFHSHSPFPPHAIDSQKSMPTHSYPLYPQVPVKYIDRRLAEPIMDGYQRSNPQANLNVSYRNPIIHPQYGPLQANCVQTNIFPYPSDHSTKSVTSNKLPYSNNNKIYVDYETSQNKKSNISETVYANEINHIHSMKGEFVYPNYPPINMHSIPQHPLYRKENILMKNFEYVPHHRNLDPSVNFHNPLLRHPIHFSPNAIAISPSDSNTSDTTLTHSITQEDCGYVSQSSSTSVRSIDSHINGVLNEHHTYKSSDYRHGFLPRNIPTQIPSSRSSKVKKDLNVRQFLQMWNEGDDESSEQNKDENVPRDSNNFNRLPGQYENANKQEQLYVLGSVNVPTNELGKYEHIQKISKLPENIKGYNNIELLNQFEEAIESTNAKHFDLKPHREYNAALKSNMSKQLIGALSRPVSPLDVEAKISQSVIHKEVGCNFEIKPCSPKMLNVEIATPIKSILDERIIEKVSNPVSAKPTMLQKTDKTGVETSNISNSPLGNSSNRDKTVPNCTMGNLKYTNDHSTDPVKGNYSLQDLVYNSSVCLASLPRLDNDIELNFPEINQQFIDANKMESVIASTSIKDLPVLDDQIDNNITKNKTGKYSEAIQVSSNLESDKEFMKLSKYRKVKKPDLEQTKTYNRTDSVIIKNPDLIKNLEAEEQAGSSFTKINKSSVGIEENNIKSSVDLIEEKSDVTTKQPSINSVQEKNFNISDIAIDFSLNKSNNELLKPCIIKKNESLLHFIEEDLNITETLDKTEFSTILNKNLSMAVNNTEKTADNNVTSVQVVNVSHQSLNTSENNNNLSIINESGSRLNNTSRNESGEEPPSEGIDNITSHKFSENIAADLYLPIESKDYEESKVEDCLTNENHSKMEIFYKKQLFAGANINKVNEYYLKSPKSMLTEFDINCEDGENSQYQMKSEYAIERKIKLLDVEKLPMDVCIARTFHKEENKFEESVVEERNSNLCINKMYFQFKKRLYSPSIQNLIIFSEDSLNNNYEDSVSQKGIKFVLNENWGKPSLNDSITINLQDDQITNLKLESLLPVTVNECIEQTLSRVVDIDERIISKDYGNNPDGFSEFVNINLNSPNEKPNSNIFGKIIDESTNNIDNSSKKNSDTMSQVADLIQSDLTECSSNVSVEKKVINNTDVQTSEFSKVLANEIICNKMKEKETDSKIDKEIKNVPEHMFTNHQIQLKRSLSDSALNLYSEGLNHLNFDSMCLVPRKRKKINPCKIMEPNIIAESLCKVIHTNRRNSISTFYNEENVSFCILIDNSCVITEEYEEESQKICLAEISEENEADFKETITTDNIIFTDESSNSENKIKLRDENFANGFVTECNVDEHSDEKTFCETWIEDVACIETVFSDDTVEDVLTDASKDNNLSECEVSKKNELIIYSDSKHMDKIKYIYGNEMCHNDAQLVEALYRTPQMNVRKTLINRESQYLEESSRYYDNDSLEKVLSESNDKDGLISNTDCSLLSCSNIVKSKNVQDDKENLEFELPVLNDEDYQKLVPCSDLVDKANNSPENFIHELTQFDTVQSCESTHDYTIPYKLKSESPKYSNFSSPEVSSTTSEEKSCGILLKITNCNGSISSLINEFDTKSTNKLSSKLNDDKELINYGSSVSSKRPLITKAAQKYIPPIKETIHDLKVKLPLPPHRLNKLKILKISKNKPKPNKLHINTHNSLKPYFPKKSKPKFEDVLKSIDEIQIKMHKEKNKKQKHSIPKVVIKKNENGAHYASTSNEKDTFNPDLTGRKWQPWVFIEKNNFVDKMAVNKNIKAVFNHRKNTYVLAENFRKYKSIRDAKFVISQPKINNISSEN